MKHENFFTGISTKQSGRGLQYNEFLNKISASNNKISAEAKDRLIDISWLEACSTIYNISKNPKDYTFGVVRSLVADLPNRNGHCFELNELLKFNIDAGCQAYKTFEGKPLLTNHRYELPDANGVIISASLTQDGPYISTELVVGIDQKKRPDVAKAVKEGNASFSMGAVCETFECSICKERFALTDPDQHCNSTGLYKPYGDNARLAYMRAINVTFIENSFLLNSDPADPRALHTNMPI